MSNGMPYWAIMYTDAYGMREAHVIVRYEATALFIAKMLNAECDAWEGFRVRKLSGLPFEGEAIRKWEDSEP